MASRLILPYSRVDDNNGHPLDGAKLYFFENGTGTPKNTFSDVDATTPNTNPVIADSQGQFGDIYLVGIYRVMLDDKNDVTQPDYPADDVVEIGVITGTQKLSKGADVVSEAALFTTEGFPTDGNYFDITGTTTITSIITSDNSGTVIKLHFDGVLTLTHDGTNLILPTLANITTAAGDEAEFVEYASGAWRCTNYQSTSNVPVTIGTTQTITGIKTLENAQPTLFLSETGVAAENGKWNIAGASEALHIQTVNDAKDTFSSIVRVERSGTTPTSFKVFPRLIADGGVETDGTNALKTKIIDIGDWDMVATSSVNVAHGLTLADIRNVSVVIRHDADTNHYPLDRDDNTNVAGNWSANATNITMNRIAGALFDNTNFDSTSFNRGWITITHIA